MFRSAATKIAHNSTLSGLGGNSDLRPLQDLILAEKTVLTSLQKISADYAKAAESLRTWGLNEGMDLGDILGTSAHMLILFSSALSQYAAHGHAMRDHLKAIRTREEALEDLRSRKRALERKAEDTDRKLARTGPTHKNAIVLRDTLGKLLEEIGRMNIAIQAEEAASGDFKRQATRAWMGLKFGGLLELCEKGTIVAEFGKMTIGEISEEVTQPGLPRTPYAGQNKTEQYLAKANACINEVALSTAPSIAFRDLVQQGQGYQEPAPPQNNTQIPYGAIGNPAVTATNPAFSNQASLPPANIAYNTNAGQWAAPAGAQPQVGTVATAGQYASPTGTLGSLSSPTTSTFSTQASVSPATDAYNATAQWAGAADPNAHPHARMGSISSATNSSFSSNQVNQVNMSVDPANGGYAPAPGAAAGQQQWAPARSNTLPGPYATVGIAAAAAQTAYPPQPDPAHRVSMSISPAGQQLPNIAGLDINGPARVASPAPMANALYPAQVLAPVPQPGQPQSVDDFGVNIHSQAGVGNGNGAQGLYATWAGVGHGAQAQQAAALPEKGAGPENVEEVSQGGNGAGSQQ